MHYSSLVLGIFPSLQNLNKLSCSASVKYKWDYPATQTCLLSWHSFIIRKSNILPLIFLSPNFQSMEGSVLSFHVVRGGAAGSLLNASMQWLAEALPSPRTTWASGLWPLVLDGSVPCVSALSIALLSPAMAVSVFYQSARSLLFRITRHALTGINGSSLSVRGVESRKAVSQAHRCSVYASINSSAISILSCLHFQIFDYSKLIPNRRQGNRSFPFKYIQQSLSTCPSLKTMRIKTEKKPSNHNVLWSISYSQQGRISSPGRPGNLVYPSVM
jgi:hypothetical protein